MNSVNYICDDIIKYSKDPQVNKHPRDDYQKLLDIMVIFIYEILPIGFNFKKTGRYIFIMYYRWPKLFMI